MTPDVLNAIQWFTARSAITSSSMRGSMGGTIEAARDYLGSVALKEFGSTNQAHFQDRLDRRTEELLAELPKAARHWGRARKGLNIFLRGCLHFVLA
jgi:hypothetical protein